MVLPGIFDAHNIPDAFNHADGPVVTGPVGTDGADLVVRNHRADPAVTGLVTKVVDGGGKVVDILGRLLQKMEGKPEGAPSPNPWKRAYGINGIRQQLRGIMLCKRGHYFFPFKYASTAARTWPYFSRRALAVS